MSRSRSTFGLLPMLGLALVAGCGGSGTEPKVTDLASYISGVATANGAISAAFRSGNPPQGSGPVVNATGSSSLIVGGTSIRSLSSSTAFNRVIVAVEGVPGYWELTLGSNVTTQDIILSVAQTLPANSFTCNTRPAPAPESAASIAKSCRSSPSAPARSR